MKTIVGNGTVVQGDGTDFIINGAVVYEEDTIIDVGTTGAMFTKYNDAKFIDAQGGMIMPGFVCAHGHYYGMFSRGMSLKDPAPYTFVEILERLWWRLDKALESEDNYLSAMVCIENAILSGCTTIIDHHASPNAIEGSLNILADAGVKAGIRSCLCYEVTDRNGTEGALAGIKENISFIKRCHDNPHPLLSAMFGLHASFTCSDGTLAACKTAVESLPYHDSVGFHVHVAEAASDEKHCIDTHKCNVVERLKKQGIINKNTVLGHCVHVNDHELEMIKEAGCTVVHNPQSNMNNGVGIPRIPKMISMGIPCCLGTDGISYDMIAEAKAAYFVHKLVNQDPRVMGGDPWKMLTVNNAELASRMFGKKLGVLKAGAAADIIVMKYDPPTPVSAGSLPWHVQFGMDSGMVNTTICNGRVIMHDRKILSFDTAAIKSKSRDRAPGVWKRF